MINKIISNKNLIAEILLILAIALLAPEIIALFGQDFTNSIFTLILHVTAILSAVYLLVLLLTKKELSNKALLIAVALLFAGPLTSNIRGLIEFKTWNYPYYIALYGAAILFYVLLLVSENKKLPYIVYILFMIILSFNLLAVFNGSSTGLARLIIGLIIIGNVYLNLTQGKEKEDEIK